jgi:hypothetical protein
VLKQNFAAYLHSSFGRQGIKNMSEVTVGLYVSSLFSLTRTNSFKQFLRRTSGFNSDFELQELMFRPNMPIYIQESIFKKGVLPGPASGLEPSQSSCTASALLKLLEYFRACESQLRLNSNMRNSVINGGIIATASTGLLRPSSPSSKTLVSSRQRMPKTAKCEQRKKIRVRQRPGTALSSII